MKNNNEPEPDELKRGWDSYLEICEAWGPDVLANAKTHEDAVNNLRGDAWLLDWYRHPVIVRRPRTIEYSEHKKRLGAAREDYRGSERVTRMESEIERFARDMVIYPSTQKLDELCTQKLDLLDAVYGLLTKIISDALEADFVKLRAR